MSFLGSSLLPLPELQRSDSHKQAKIVDSESSEMSFGSQEDFTFKGSSIGPRRIDLDKHSLMMDEDDSDCCQEYQRQASPGWQ